MSHESRLERLGLLHLKDDPEALAKETERRIAEFEEKLAGLPPSKPAPAWAEALADNLNRNVLAEQAVPQSALPADQDAAHKQRWQEIGSEIAAKRAGAQPLTHEEYSRRQAQAMVDGLNRAAMAEHEADLAALPPDIRASRTPEEWLATPPLEIMRLAANAKSRAAASTPQAAPVPGFKGWVRRAGEAIAASLRRATTGK